MASTALEILIKAKDLAKGTIDKVKGSLASFSNKSEEAAKSTDKLGNSSASTSKKVNNFSGTLKSAALKLGIFAAAAAAVRAVGGLFGRAVDDAEKLETQTLKLNQAIKATGGAAGLTADEILEMADRLDEATLGSEQGFRDAALQLLTFKSIGKNVFESVLLQAQNLSEAGLGTLNDSVKQLGKALEDPAQGLSALSRAGVTFSESQKEMIKGLVETGQKAEAQRIILAALEGQVGGLAKAAGSGLSGAVDLVGKRFTDLRENLGKGVIPILTDLNNRFADWLKQLNDSGAIKEFGIVVGGVFAAIVAVVEKVITTFQVFFNIAETGFDVLKGSFQEFESVIFSIVRTIATGIGDLIETVGKVADLVPGLGDVSQSILGLADDVKTTAKELGVLSDTLDNESTKSFENAAGAANTAVQRFKELAGQTADLKTKADEAGTSVKNLGKETKQAGDKTKDLAQSNDDLDRSLKTVNGRVNKIITEFSAWEKSSDGAEKALKKLTDDQLKKGINDLSKAIENGSNTTQNAKKSLEAFTEEAVRRTGIDLAELKGQVTETGKSMVNAFTSATRSGLLNREELTRLALKYLELAKTPGDVKAIGEAMKEAGIATTGATQAAEAFKNRLKETKDELKGIKDQNDDTEDSYDDLGNAGLAAYENLAQGQQNIISNQQVILNGIQQEISLRDRLAQSKDDRFGDSDFAVVEDGRVTTSALSNDTRGRLSGLNNEQLQEFNRLFKELLVKFPSIKPDELAQQVLSKVESSVSSQISDTLNGSDNDGGSSDDTQSFIRETTDQVRQLTDSAASSSESTERIRQVVEESALKNQESISSIEKIMSDFLTSQQQQLPVKKVELQLSVGGFTGTGIFDDTAEFNQLIESIENSRRTSN